MPHLELSFLGPFSVKLDGQTVTGFESDKSRALLAYLALENDLPKPRQALADLLWPQHPQARARRNLSQALYNLHKALGERPTSGNAATDATKSRGPPGGIFLLTTPHTIQFNPASKHRLDVAEFQVLLRTCQTHPHAHLETCAECACRLEKAADLYRGDFLTGVEAHEALGFEEWRLVTQERLRLDLRWALEALRRSAEAQGKLETALQQTRRLVELDPWWEEGQRALMRLLALDGQGNQALANFVHYRHRLVKELGVQPDLATAALAQRLRLEEKGETPDHLPEPMTAFIGRQAELAEVSALLQETPTRLVTILGPGGSGKTRLAIHAARARRFDFPDGVHFISLSPLTSSASLVPAVAEVLGFTFQPGRDPKAQLMDYLRPRRLLLVMDSFEAVLEGAAWAVEALQVVPGLKVLATSRASLNALGERLYPLGGMCYPHPTEADSSESYSAVELFLEGARRAQPSFRLKDENRAAVAAICQLVAGMPLGLLLASTWVSDYPPEEIVGQIRRSLDFLSVNWVDLPERQRSLRATFEYSWNLLSRGEQHIFQALAALRGDFSAQAACQVAQADLQMLHVLLGKSLLVSEADGRYRMHDLVRQFGAEKLAEDPEPERAVRQRHASYYLERAAGWEKRFKSPEQGAVLKDANAEIDNVQAAWEWATRQGDVHRLAAALEGIGTYYELRQRHAEGKGACQAARDGLAGCEEPGAVSLLGWLQAWQARFCRLLGQVEQARELREASRRTLAWAEGEQARRGLALLEYEWGYTAGDLAEQLDSLQHSAALYQALEDSWRQAGSLSWAGEIAHRLGKNDLAFEHLEAAVGSSRAVGEPRQLASALERLAYPRLILGQWELGVRLMEEAGENFRLAGDPGQEGIARLHLGVMLGWTGRFEEAIELLGQALPLLHQIGDRFYIACGTLALGVCQMHLGEYEQAVRTLQSALHAACQDGFARETAACLAMLGCVDLVRGQPAQAQAELHESVERYRKQSAVGELGMALGGLALAELALGHKEATQAALQEALRIAVETHSHFTLITSWAAAVTLLAEAGRWAQTLEVYAAGQGVPLLSNSRWQADLVAPGGTAAVAHLPPEVAGAARERGRGRDLFAIAQELLEECQVKITPEETRGTPQEAPNSGSAGQEAGHSQESRGCGHLPRMSFGSFRGGNSALSPP